MRKPRGFGRVVKVYSDDGGADGRLIRRDGVVSQRIEGGPLRRDVEFPQNWNPMPMMAGYAVFRDGTLAWVNLTPYAGAVLIRGVE